MSDSNSDQTTPTRARMSRVVPTVVGVLALVAAAFTVGRWSKAPVADVRESTMLAVTAPGFVNGNTPGTIVSGTPKAITLTFTAIAGDMVAWAPTGKCAGATYQAATVGKDQANTFTVVGDGALKLCFRRPANDGTTPVEQTGPALTASMDVNNWGTCYSQATVGKAYAQLQVLDNIIRGNAADLGTDNAVTALRTFYGNTGKCDATCKANADQAMSQMLSGVAAGAAR